MDTVTHEPSAAPDPSVMRGDQVAQSLSRRRLRLAAFILACASSLSTFALFAGEEFRIAGYLPEYRLEAFDPATHAQLSDLIVFSGEPSATGELELARLKDVPWDKLKAFKERHHVRLNLSLGGWRRSDHFAAVAAAAEKRAIFAQACLRFCQEHAIDCLDLDWEHPEGEAQQRDYVLLLRELQEAFAPHGVQVSLTIAPDRELLPEAFAVVDWIQVMSYDSVGRHATYEKAVADIEALLARGAPREKLVMGIPFYGRHTQRDEILSYREILAKYHPDPAADDVAEFHFNGLDTIRRKVDYAVKSKLGGVMVWELGQDSRDEKSLLKAIAEQAKKQQN